MLLCVSCILYMIYITSASFIEVTVGDNKDKSINLAVDALVDLQGDDTHANIKFLDKVEKIIDKVKNVIDDNGVSEQSGSMVSKVDTLTAFIIDAIEILEEFEDDDLEHVFEIIYDEIANYNYKGCKFYEIAENDNLKEFIASKLDEYINLSASGIRNNLLAISHTMEEDKYDNNEREIVDFIDSLYKNSADKFEDILDDLDDYKKKTKKGMNLINIVKKGLRSILFDFYTNLNEKDRAKLRFKVKIFWDNFIMNPPSIVSKKNMDYTSPDIIRNDHTIYDSALRTSGTISNTQKTIFTGKKHKRKPSSLFFYTPPSTPLKGNKRSIQALKQTIPMYVKPQDSKYEKRLAQVPTTRKFKAKKSKSNKVLNMARKPSTSGHKVFIEIMTMKPFVPRKKFVSNKLKYEINLMKPALRIPTVATKETLNPIGRLVDHIHVEGQKIYDSYSKSKSATTRYTAKQHGQHPDNIDINKSFDVYSLENSRDDSKDASNGGYYKMKNNNINTKDNELVNNNVLTRLKHLDNELKVVKNHMKNKADLIKDLKRKAKLSAMIQYKRPFKIQHALTTSTRKMINNKYSNEISKSFNNKKNIIKEHIPDDYKKKENHFNKGLLSQHEKNNEVIHSESKDKFIKELEKIYYKTHSNENHENKYFNKYEKKKENINYSVINDNKGRDANSEKIHKDIKVIQNKYDDFNGNNNIKNEENENVFDKLLINKMHGNQSNVNPKIDTYQQDMDRIEHMKGNLESKYGDHYVFRKSNNLDTFKNQNKSKHHKKKVNKNIKISKNKKYKRQNKIKPYQKPRRDAKNDLDNIANKKDYETKNAIYSFRKNAEGKYELRKDTVVKDVPHISRKKKDNDKERYVKSIEKLDSAIEAENNSGNKNQDINETEKKLDNTIDAKSNIGNKNEDLNEIRKKLDSSIEAEKNIFDKNEDVGESKKKLDSTVEADNYSANKNEDLNEMTKKLDSTIRSENNRESKNENINEIKNKFDGTIKAENNIFNENEDMGESKKKLDSTIETENNTGNKNENLNEIRKKLGGSIEAKTNNFDKNEDKGESKNKLDSTIETENNSGNKNENLNEIKNKLDSSMEAKNNIFDKNKDIGESKKKLDSTVETENNSGNKNEDLNEGKKKLDSTIEAENKSGNKNDIEKKSDTSIEAENIIFTKNDDIGENKNKLDSTIEVENKKGNKNENLTDIKQKLDSSIEAENNIFTQNEDIGESKKNIDSTIEADNDSGNKNEDINETKNKLDSPIEAENNSGDKNEAISENKKKLDSTSEADNNSVEEKSEIKNKLASTIEAENNNGNINEDMSKINNKSDSTTEADIKSIDENKEKGEIKNKFHSINEAENNSGNKTEDIREIKNKLDSTIETENNSDNNIENISENKNEYVNITARADNIYDTNKRDEPMFIYRRNENLNSSLDDKNSSSVQSKTIFRIGDASEENIDSNNETEIRDGVLELSSESEKEKNNKDISNENANYITVLDNNIIEKTRNFSDELNNETTFNIGEPTTKTISTESSFIRVHTRRTKLIRQPTDFIRTVTTVIENKNYKNPEVTGASTQTISTNIENKTIPNNKLLTDNVNSNQTDKIFFRSDRNCSGVEIITYCLENKINLVKGDSDNDGKRKNNDEYYNKQNVNINTTTKLTNDVKNNQIENTTSLDKPKLFRESEGVTLFRALQESNKHQLTGDRKRKSYTVKPVKHTMKYIYGDFMELLKQNENQNITTNNKHLVTNVITTDKNKHVTMTTKLKTTTTKNTSTSKKTSAVVKTTISSTETTIPSTKSTIPSIKTTKITKELATT